MGNGVWNTNPLQHCCEDIYRDDCDECYGDNVGCADIIINEIMNNPEVVIDAMGEWFELYNYEESPISLQGWLITDGHSPPEDQFLIEDNLVIAPKGFVVLGNNADFNTNGGIIVDYEYSNLDFSLFNGPDEILLQSQKSDNIWKVRDKVEWGNADYNQSGYSQSLKGVENYDEFVDQNDNFDGELSDYNDIDSLWQKASRINGNGIWDEGEDFFDCHIAIISNTEIEICENDINWIDSWGDGQYQNGEPFIDQIENGDNNSNGRPNFDSELVFENFECNGSDDCSEYTIEDECPEYCSWQLAENELVFQNVMVSDSDSLSLSFINDGYGTLIINSLDLNSEYYQSDKIFDLYSCNLGNLCIDIDSQDDCYVNSMCNWVDLSEECDDTDFNGCDPHEIFYDCGYNDDGSYICVDCFHPDHGDCEGTFGDGIWNEITECSYVCDQIHYVTENDSIVLNVSFSPGEIKSYSGELIIQTNDFENSFYEVPIYGSGIGMSSLISTDEILFFDIIGHVGTCDGCESNLNIYNSGVETLEIEEFGMYYGDSLIFSGNLYEYYTIDPNHSISIGLNFINSLFNQDSLDYGEKEIVLDCIPF